MDIIGLKVNDNMLYYDKAISPNEQMVIPETRQTFETTLSLVFNYRQRQYEFLIDEYYLNFGQIIDIIEHDGNVHVML